MPKKAIRSYLFSAERQQTPRNGFLCRVLLKSGHARCPAADLRHLVRYKGDCAELRCLLYSTAVTVKLQSRSSFPSGSHLRLQGLYSLGQATDPCIPRRHKKTSIQWRCKGDHSLFRICFSVRYCASSIFITSVVNASALYDSYLKSRLMFIAFFTSSMRCGLLLHQS